MKLLRNPEVFKAFTILIVITFLMILCTYSIFPYIWLVLCINNTCVAILFYRLLSYRYREIAQLANDLQRIYEGVDDVLVLDHQEGELSILKNDIYKVTQTLKHQRELSRKERVQLADSLSNISHQLKTPLTSLMVMCDLLRMEDLPEGKRMEFTSQMQVQLQRLEWLITALLKLSKFDAGTIVFDCQSSSLAVILNDCVAMLQMRLELQTITLTLDCAEAICLRCDVNWMKEAFVNILKNAIEHTSIHGHIQINVTQDILATHIQIQDDGCGIAQDQLSHIFERFYRGEQQRQDHVGIGLSLSKMIIEEHEGCIQVKSTLGKGTCFTITFPTHTGMS